MEGTPLEQKTLWIDPAYRLRYPPISFERNLETTDDEKKEFNLWWDANYHKLGVFGDFAARYIIENPQLLKELRWHELGQRIIEEFYTECSNEIPEWVNALLLSNVVEESNEITYFEVRAFLEQAIIDSYRKDPDHLRDSYGSEIPQSVTFENKLEICIAKRLISFLHKKFDKSKGCEMLVITQNVITELHNKRISNVITMQALADEIEGFEYRNLRINGKKMRVVIGAVEDFMRFLSCDFEEEIKL